MLSYVATLSHLFIFSCFVALSAMQRAPQDPSGPEDAVFVGAGRPASVRVEGKVWTAGDGYVECGGTENFLYGGKGIGPGDFTITARLSIEDLTRSAATFTIGGHSHFGFEGGAGQMFVEGPFFGASGAKYVGPNTGIVTQGKPLRLEVVRRGTELTIAIDGRQVYRGQFTEGPVGRVGFRPWRATMRIFDFAATGQLVELPKRPQPTQTDADPPTEHVTVYTSGRGDYHTYRIPSVIVTQKETVLAFCEGRKNSRSDSGDIDLLLRRSSDGGQTFSEPQVVWDDGPNTCGNPCPVIDRETGTIWLLATHNLGVDREPQIVERKSRGTRTVWVAKSTDDGLSWSKPVEITAATKQSSWTWYATGPGCGIQTRTGRLVIPCDHIDSDTGQWSSHVVFSDDHGKTWKLGGSAPPKTNECEVVELADGRLLLNMRNYNRQHPCRAVATSRDEGETFGEVSYDETLVEPVCQASIRRGLKDKDGHAPILFSNPAQTGARKQMTVRLSRDEGKSWPVAQVLHAGPAAYSCLAVLGDGTILCLYERGTKSAYETIALARFKLDWLTAAPPEN